MLSNLSKVGNEVWHKERIVVVRLDRHTLCSFFRGFFFTQLYVLLKFASFLVSLFLCRCACLLLKVDCEHLSPVINAIVSNHFLEISSNSWSCLCYVKSDNLAKKFCSYKSIHSQVLPPDHAVRRCLLLMRADILTENILFHTLMRISPHFCKRTTSTKERF